MKGSKRKGRRPGTWELRVDAGRDPLTRKRQQKSVIFHGTSREADVALAELITKASRGRSRSAPAPSPTPIEAGLRQAELEGLEPTTMRGYRTSADCHVLPALGSKRLSHLTAEHLDRFYGALVEPATPARPCGAVTSCCAGCSTRRSAGDGSRSTSVETPGRHGSTASNPKPVPIDDELRR